MKRCELPWLHRPPSTFPSDVPSHQLVCMLHNRSLNDVGERRTLCIQICLKFTGDEGASHVSSPGARGSIGRAYKQTAEEIVPASWSEKNSHTFVGRWFLHAHRLDPDKHVCAPPHVGEESDVTLFSVPGRDETLGACETEGRTG